MKRVVLLKSHVAQHGGLEKYAERIAEGFLSRQMEVSILTTGAKTLAHPPNVAVYAVNTWPWPGFWRMEQFDRFVRKWLQDHPADLVFGMDRNRYQTHYRAGNGVHAAFLESRRLFESRFKKWTLSFNPLHLKILEMEKCAFENPHLVKLFANSHMVKDEILRFYRVDSAKIEVIHNGVEWKEMEGDFNAWPSLKKQAAEKYGLDPAAFYFLFIGNGYLRKGLKQLMKAMRQLPSSCHLLIIGKDNRSEEFKRLSCDLKLSRRVHFFGPQKNIRPFYQMADALVIPSFYDPFANVTVEALAMGLFVVSSKKNGGHEILTEENGSVIENLLDIDSLAVSLETALRHPKTMSSSKMIRSSVQHLDFSHQMQLLIDSSLRPHGS